MAAIRPLSASDVFIGDPRPDERRADSNIINHLLRSTAWSEYVDPSTADQDALMSLTANKARFNRNDLLSSQSSTIQSPISPPANINSNNLGDLSRLPIEVIHCFIDHMDFLSLATFAQTCHYARMIVESHPTLKLLLKHCAHIRRWLWSTQLIFWPSLLNIKNELFQPNCRGCGSRGDLFHIPTCERICSNCNEHNPQYWCIRIKDAHYAFNLDIDTVKSLPLVRVFRRHLLHPHSPFGVLTAEWLVPVRTAFDTAVERHGSVTKMQKAGQATSPDRFGDPSAEESEIGRLYSWLRTPQTPDNLAAIGPMRADWPDYHSFSSRLVVSFEYLESPRAAPAEYYSCKGCLWCVERYLRPTERQVRYMGLDTELSDAETAKMLGIRTKVVRTKEEHIKHLSTCLGGGLLLWNTRVPDEIKDEYRQR